VTAYKFLRPGRLAPFSAFPWPVETWVAAEPDPCASGIHACAVEDLPYWLHAELWEIELDAPTRHERKLVAPRGRLTRRVDAWDAAAQQDFRKLCEARVRELAGSDPAAAVYVADFSGRWVRQCIAAAGFVAARAAECVAGPAAYADERRRQAAWLAGRLELTP
jgi:hypothetical protein